MEFLPYIWHCINSNDINSLVCQIEEIGQLNDYAYRDDPDKAPDSRYVNRGAMNWEEAAKSSDQTTIPGQISSKLNQLEKLRKSEKAFMSNADTWTVETWERVFFVSDAIMMAIRYMDYLTLVNLIRRLGSSL